MIRFQTIREEASDGSDAGGGTAPPAVEFTSEQQSVIDRVVKERVAKEQKRYQAEIARYQSEAQNAADYAKKAEELEHQLAVAGKDESGKRLAELERNAQKLQQQLDAAAKERDEAVKGFTTVQQERDRYILNREFSDALLKKGCLPEAVKDATDLLISTGNVQVERDEDGKIKITAQVGSLFCDDPMQAAEAYLKARPHFASVSPGGGGTTRPNAGLNGRKASDLTGEQLIALSFANKT
jgi:hypothetical protein